MADGCTECVIVMFGQINPCTANGNPCANGATCVALQQGRFKCECLPGWEGQHCELNTGKNLFTYLRSTLVQLRLVNKRR